MIEGCTPWPEDLARTYREDGLWRGQTLAAGLAAWAGDHGDRIALVDGHRRISYRELSSWTKRLAAGFAERGLHAGDRVVVQLPNTADFVAVCFGLFQLGVLPVFALPPYRSTEIGHLFDISGAVAYVVPDRFGGCDYRELAAIVAESQPSLRDVYVIGDPGDFMAMAEVEESGARIISSRPDEFTFDHQSPASEVAFFLLSGGTTALPKLIPRTHDDYLYQTRTAAALSNFTAETRYLALLPVEFNFTWGCPGVIGTLQAGGTVVLAANPSPHECFALIERERVTATSMVPTVVHLWLDAVTVQHRDLSSLELIQVGSAKLHREVAQRIEPAFGCRLQQVFGMAEGLLTFTRLDDPDEVVLAGQGRPISPADQVRVVGPDGVAVSPGQAGELVTQGPYTLRGYYRAPEHNTHAFTADGFYRSGDLVRFTEDGNMVVEGRIKDVIIRGGDKISAVEIEAEITAHPAVQQAAVVAMPDPVLGERTCAFVIADGTPPTLPQLRSMLRDSGLADFKLPDRLQVVDGFPLTGLGKVDKKALAASLTHSTAGPS